MRLRPRLSLALLGLALVPAAALAAPSAPSVPAAIAITDGSKPYLVAHASGVQIYTCVGSWVLQRPDAVLTDDKVNVIGSHYGGPSWEAKDGSVVKAARDAGVSVDARAIDWLRLKVTSATEGRFERTRWIQRINTVGGRAPAGACPVGTGLEVPYTADYVFWK